MLPNLSYEDKILSILKTKSLVNEINLSFLLKDDLKFDPMDFFDIILEIEQFFSIELNDDDIYKIMTVADLIKNVQEKI